jgi:hypothetical protein
LSERARSERAVLAGAASRGAAAAPTLRLPPGDRAGCDAWRGCEGGAES